MAEYLVRLFPVSQAANPDFRTVKKRYHAFMGQIGVAVFPDGVIKSG
jgi:hypothetical protein